MLPQFGYIVAQAGADYYSSPLPTSPTLSVTNTNNHSALAPLLNKTSSNVILPPPSSFLPKKDIWYRPPSPIIQQEPQQDHSWQDTFKQEYNDLMTFMDNEFWEQTDELYKEKLSKLENELLLLQSGTHSVFKEMLSDYELKRDKIIQDAEIYMQYQISFIENHYNQNLSAVEDEYQTEKKNLEESLIEDKKRQMKEDNKEEDQDDSHQHRSKRNLRKRNADTGSTLKSEPLTKKRSVRPSTPHNIYTISSIEEEELEMEFLQIKKLVAASR